MIARLWHGMTNSENSEKYERLLLGEILPGIHRVEGYRGAYLLRREIPEGVEFVTLTLFDSMDAVRRFAGEDIEAAVVPEEARRLLARFDARSVHYTIVAEPSALPAGATGQAS
jgi:heme-degrading monooxygenase HmoA